MHSQSVSVCARTERTASARVASARYAGMTIDTRIRASIYPKIGVRPVVSHFPFGKMGNDRADPDFFPNAATPAVGDVFDPEGVREPGAGSEEGALMDFRGHGSRVPVLANGFHADDGVGLGLVVEGIQERCSEFLCFAEVGKGRLRGQRSIAGKVHVDLQVR